MHIEIGENLTVVKHFKYRQARVHNGNLLFAINRDEVRELEEALGKLIGRCPDNHTCYVFKSESSEPIGVWFHDSSARFGTVTLYIRSGKDSRKEIVWSELTDKDIMESL